jgi:hypothetical protein
LDSQIGFSQITEILAKAIPYNFIPPAKAGGNLKRKKPVLNQQDRLL